MSSQLQLFATQDSRQWTVRISRRARRLSVRVYPGGRVEVIAPPQASSVTVQRFVGLHRSWIDDRVREFSSENATAATERPSQLDLTAIERSVSVMYEPDARAAVRSQFDATSNVLTVKGAIQQPAPVHAVLRDWLITFGESALSAQLARVAEQCGLRYTRMQVRRQRTRWGSCSSRRVISLNVCILFQRPAVLRYLLVHELAHTRHMNHSDAFWSLVESFEPHYRVLDRELSQGWRRVPSWLFE